MDGIVPFRDHAIAEAPSPKIDPYFATTISKSVPINPAAVKTPSDYLRAMRRRIWLILAVAVPMAIATSIWALRQPKIYQARAEITIEPPEFNPMLTTLVSHDIGRHDPAAQERYIPNRIALLQSKGLAERVFKRTRLSRQKLRLRRPGAGTHRQWLQVRPDRQDEHVPDHARRPGSRADQNPAGGSARGIQEPGTVEKAGQDGRYQGLCSTKAEQAQDRTGGSRPEHLNSSRLSARSDRVEKTSLRNNTSI